jgi:predicted nucleotidyltransferase
VNGNTVLLQGVVGSTAYGLAGPHSDVDRLGVFAAPTREFHGLYPPLDRRASIVTHEPEDLTLHEARKFCLLALGANPTVTELLWLPGYEIGTPLGKELVGIRTAFLSAPRVRDAYLGYAGQQFTRLLHKGADPRTPKHARHLLRLLHQGDHLYRTGELVVRLADPQRYHDFGNAVAEDPEVARAALDEARERFAGTRTVLPEQPDEAAVERWLQQVRTEYLSAQS